MWQNGEPLLINKTGSTEAPSRVISTPFLEPLPRFDDWRELSTFPMQSFKMTFYWVSKGPGCLSRNTGRKCWCQH